jgi:putative ATPase
MSVWPIPTRSVVAMAALQATEKIGMPEAAIPLAHATIYLACAPKSNASYLAMHRAKAAVHESEAVRVPPHLRSTSLPNAKKLGAGEGYKYPHDFPGHFVEQDYGAPPPKFAVLSAKRCRRRNRNRASSAQLVGNARCR